MLAIYSKKRVIVNFSFLHPVCTILWKYGQWDTTNNKTEIPKMKEVVSHEVINFSIVGIQLGPMYMKVKIRSTLINLANHIRWYEIGRA